VSRAWAKGSTAAWRRTRAAVLLANQMSNGGRCTLILPGCTGQATVVHHILGRSVTGDDPRYLAATCNECNLAAGEPGRTSPKPKRISNW